MAIRLYPKTQNTANLEILAGVPAGTAAKLLELETKFNYPNEVGDEYFEILYSPEMKDVLTYSTFMSFGWHRVNHLPWMEECGETIDKEQMFTIYIHNIDNINTDWEVVKDLSEGFYWY